MPTITQAVLIDGTTQTGYTNAPLIELDGTNAGANVNGLTISGSGAAAKALVINHFTANGILIIGSGATGNTIIGNYIGTNAAGNSALGNSQAGVAVQNGASNTTIGGTAAGSGNVISGNISVGVWISGAGTATPG